MASLATGRVVPLMVPRTPFEKFGQVAVRYGLVVVIAWMALMKFTSVEANGIHPLVSHSPLLGWIYRFMSVRSFSRGLGTCELTIAILIALRPLSARASALGSVGAIGMFMTTLSFLLQSAAWNPILGGFPAPSDPVGEFLLKDIVLLSVAIWSLGEAWSSIAHQAGATTVPKAAT